MHFVRLPLRSHQTKASSVNFVVLEYILVQNVGKKNKCTHNTSCVENHSEYLQRLKMKAFNFCLGLFQFIQPNKNHYGYVHTGNLTVSIMLLNTVLLSILIYA